MSVADIGFTPSTLEVDFDKNLTDLYRAITEQNWERAIDVCKRNPEQAKTWVVRHYEDGEEEGEVMWRFLPLHSACARQPPISVIASLLRAYPDGARCQDDQGMYALHYACGNQASRDVVRILLVAYQEAAKKPDPRGMLPIHYLACWGPSSVSVVDMLLVAHPNVAEARDSEGNTPLELAREGEYPEKDSVIAVLQKWFVTGLESSEEAASLSKRSTASRHSKATKSTESSSSTKKGTAASSQQVSDPAHSSSSSRKETPKKKQVNRQHQEEEKKDDDSYQAFVVAKREPAKQTVSLDEHVKLQAELAAVKAQRLILEAKVTEANIRNNRQEEQIVDLQKALREFKSSSSRLVEGVEDSSKELEKAKSKLKGCNEELRGLRLTMVDMMEEHDELKQRSTTMNDRLRSLTVTLEALMIQQKDLAKVLKARSEERTLVNRKRTENLRALLEMEESNKEEDEALELKLKKQTREMEALHAMVEAARD